MNVDGRAIPRELVSAIKQWGMFCLTQLTFFCIISEETYILSGNWQSSTTAKKPSSELKASHALQIADPATAASTEGA